MSVKLKIAEPDGIYFITITCYKWLPLFNIAGSMMAYRISFRWIILWIQWRQYQQWVGKWEGFKGALHSKESI